MHIDFSPVRMDAELTLARAGEVLIIAGVAFDFSQLAEGARLPREAVGCDWLASDVVRQDGEIHLTLLLPHGPIAWPIPEAAEAALFPRPVHVIDDGTVMLPGWLGQEALA